MVENTALGIYIVSAAKYIGAGLAVCGSIGAGIGIGIVFAGFLIAYSRNPYLENALFRNLLLGFAIVEAMGLLAIMMAFLILYS